MIPRQPAEVAGLAVRTAVKPEAVVQVGKRSVSFAAVLAAVADLLLADPVAGCGPVLILYKVEI